jgi:NAD(P)-dependent dehydrogenase (short-subunit alcohol dehydrogenase family)
MGTLAAADPTAPVTRLDGRRALVTGAGRGIGRACAIGLAHAGADVALLARSADELGAVAAVIHAAGAHASVVPSDVTDDDALDAAIHAAGDVDILVNSAGLNLPEPFTEVTREHLDRILDVNVRATFRVTQAVVRRMLSGERGGSIVTITSQMGHVGYAGRTAYCTSKHALEGLTKALAVELAPHGIRVNSVAPTFVETPMTRPMLADPAFSAEVLARIPLGRLGLPEEVAAAVVFLASDAAGLITGTSLRADGGWTAV